MEKKLKKWQGWAIFGGSMVAVFCLGLLVSSLIERRAEVASIYNNKKVEIKDTEYDKVARNDIYRDNYPREFQTWQATDDTTFVSEFNSSNAVDVLMHVQTYRSFGLDMHSPGTIPLHADTCTLLRISLARSAQERPA